MHRRPRTGCGPGRWQPGTWFFRQARALRDLGDPAWRDRLRRKPSGWPEADHDIVRLACGGRGTAKFLGRARRQHVSRIPSSCVDNMT
jgi:hypothetical protein